MNGTFTISYRYNLWIMIVIIIIYAIGNAFAIYAKEIKIHAVVAMHTRV